MSDEQPKSEHKDTTEILAEALADSNRQANDSSKNTVRVLGTLLAFSVLGNFALAGLNISGKFLGTDINMGNPDAGGEVLMMPPEEFGYMEMEPEEPPAEWCGEMKALGELAPEDEQWCRGLYPGLGQ
jgi:hypothetical protein